MSREENERYIREHATDYFSRDKSGKGYICPICGSGSGNKGTGMTENPKSKGHFTCWAGCFENEDIFGIIAHKYNLTGFNDIYNKACEIYGLSNDDAQTTAPKATVKATADDSAVNFKELYAEARKHIEETDYHRGISLETLRAYWVGYLPEWRHPKSPNAPLTPRLIIPTSWEGYLARDTRANIPDNEKKYEKQHAGSMGIWNAKAIQESQVPIYVFEGEIDALSLIDAGGMAVALCSTVNAKKFLDLVKRNRPKYGFILSLDNDEAGKKATEIISSGLNELKIPFCVYALPDQYKDANEFFVANRNAFEEWGKQGFAVFTEKRKEQEVSTREEFESESAYSDLGDFLHTLKTSREGKSISTGFSQLDGLLDGGIFPGLYFLGALSSLGKTSFTLQIADHIAKKGRGVLFFSLEMSRRELIAKSLSRLTRQLCGCNTKYSKTTRGILRADFNPAEQELFTQAVNEYSGYASNLFFTEGIGDVGVSEIKKKIERFMTFNNGIPPVVVIDYAQILAPANERYTDKQNTDKNVLELKRISRDFQIPVFAISSFNRENYGEPVKMSSFKESGSVEYSSDCLIGLQYAGVDYRRGEKDNERKQRIQEILDKVSLDAKNGLPIEIECKILKNRNGAKGCVKFLFHPMFNLFEEV